MALAAGWFVLVAAAIGVGFHGARRAAAGRRLSMTPMLCQRLQAVRLPAQCQNQAVRYCGFNVNYNARYHLPNCVTYTITSAKADGALERQGKFAADPSVAGCAGPDAYAGSGYQRGHMAPAGDMRWSARAMAESFLMTNVCPQSKSLNEGGWGKLEEKVREWARRDSVLIVITGPVLKPGLKTIGNPRVAVPEQFFKVVMAPYATPLRAIGFIYSNKACGQGLEEYAASVDEVECLTGFDFFTALPPEVERRVEARYNLLQWTR